MNSRPALLAQRAMLLIAVMTVAACAAELTNTLQEGNPAVFAAARTFTIVPPEAPPPTAQAAQLRAQIESQIAGSLQGKGYQSAAPSVARLKVSYQLVPLGSRLRDESVPPAVAAHVKTGPGDPYGGYRPPAGADATEKFGMLMLSVTDAASGGVVWQGSSEGTVTSRLSMIRTGRQAVRELLAGAPRATP